MKSGMYIYIYIYDYTYMCSLRVLCIYIYIYIYIQPSGQAACDTGLLYKQNLTFMLEFNSSDFRVFFLLDRLQYHS